MAKAKKDYTKQLTQAEAFISKPPEDAKATEGSDTEQGDGQAAIIAELERKLAEAEADNRKKDRELKEKDEALEAARKPRETKSKRINLLLRPSVYEGAVKRAERKGIKSINDYVDKLLERTNGED